MNYEFRECPTCAQKPGMPYLCDSCLHNRAVITALSKEAGLFVPYTLMVWREDKALIVWQGNVVATPQQDTVWKMVGEHAQGLVAPMPGGERTMFRVELQRSPR